MPVADARKIEIGKQIRRWRENAVYAVDKLFNAGISPDDPNYLRPDPAQVQILELFNDPENQRIAMKACKGPGKTTVIAWICWIFLATREQCNIAACSISRDNLRDNLWKEMSKWYQRAPYLQAMFAVETTRIFSRRYKETWWMSARSWSKSADKSQQDNTLAGLHADHTLAVLDESGGIPDGVMATAEGTLSTVGGEHRIIQAGNPTNLEGPLYRACTIERHLWKVIEITGDPDDPKRSTRISVKWAKEQIEKYGKDNPWVLVNVFGKFPPSSINSFLGPDEVVEAMQRIYHPTVYGHEAKIMGVDVGRFGGARSVIFPRQGLQAFEPVVLRPNRSERNWTGNLSGRIVQGRKTWETLDGRDVDRIFIDSTGGWGAGVLDLLVSGGNPAQGIQFSQSAIDQQHYKNIRAEMYFKAAEWVRKGGSLPNIPELVREATVATYTYRDGKMLVEDKEQITEKLGGESPDLWDAFILTHAQDVIPSGGYPGMGDASQGRCKTEREEE